MTDNKDPISCIACGTVNPWMNQTCRGCGADLAQQASGEDTATDDPPGPQTDGDSESAAHELSSQERDHSEAGPIERPADNIITSSIKPQWNVLWICIGIAAYIGVVAIGEFLVAKWVIAPDPQLKAMIERTQSGDAEITDADRENLRSMLFGNRVFLVLMVVLLIVAPFAIAAAVGYFSRSLKEGATALGVAVFIVCVMERQILIGIVMGLFYTGLGLVGSMTGNWIRHKLRESLR